MSAEENKAVIRQFIAEVNEKGLQTSAERFLAPSYVDHGSPPGLPLGPEGWRQLRATIFNAFPDLQITVEDLVAEGNKVAVHWSMRATHQGELMGILPTGKGITMTGIDINWLEGGKIVERWGNEDTLGMLQQLGVIPAAEQSSE